MIARSALTGSVYVIRPVVWCHVCKAAVVADSHECDLTRDPGTDDLIRDLKTAAAAATATTAETPTTT